MIRSAHWHTSCMSWVAMTAVSVMPFISSAPTGSPPGGDVQVGGGLVQQEDARVRAMPMARLARRIWPPDISRPSRWARSVRRKRGQQVLRPLLPPGHLADLHGIARRCPPGWVLDEHLLGVFDKPGDLRERSSAFSLMLSPEEGDRPSPGRSRPTMSFIKGWTSPPRWNR